MVLDKIVKAMPLSNNTVSRRIDEISEDIEKQLVEKLKTRKFSVQTDESTLIDSVAVLITYGAPNMMGKKNGCLKLMKDENLGMIFVHGENLIAKNISPVLNDVLHSVIKCINAIKTNAKCERLFKLFCEEKKQTI
ncbi:protein FAM200A-like [Parasteatoda tepidariorum]|uniref:protein FAM200A-like n=1 Tax=Parasteatoda tepidariorum TaxID=114398 RepID=UPI0039BD47CC